MWRDGVCSANTTVCMQLIVLCTQSTSRRSPEFYLSGRDSSLSDLYSALSTSNPNMDDLTPYTL